MSGNGDIAGLLLAGGLSRRMGGGDKCLRRLGDQTILARIIERMAAQLGPLALNANGDAGRFREYGLEVLPDVVADNPGPLAGVLTGMDWAAVRHPDCTFIATIPTDAPFLPRDLIARLATAVEREGSDMACAASRGRNHPVVALWPVRLRTALRAAMLEEGIRKVDIWTGRYRLSVVEFDNDDYDPFFNTNRPEDLEKAAAYLPMI